MHGRWERDADQAAALPRAIAQACGLRPVALHDALKVQGWKSMLAQFAADWFHPNDRGHHVGADAFWQQLSDDPVIARLEENDKLRRTLSNANREKVQIDQGQRRQV